MGQEITNKINPEIGKMNWKACEYCKNQAGPKGCNSFACFEDLIEYEEKNGIIICSYFVEKELA